MRTFLVRTVLIAAMGIEALAQEPALEQFEKKIRPVLATHCYACHSSSVAVPQVGLRLDSVAGIRKGGNSGPIIQPGDADHSLILRAIRYTDTNLKMPPGKPLSPDVVADFERWIRDGAPLPTEPAKE